MNGEDSGEAFDEGVKKEENEEIKYMDDEIDLSSSPEPVDKNSDKDPDFEVEEEEFNANQTRSQRSARKAKKRFFSDDEDDLEENGLDEEKAESKSVNSSETGKEPEPDDEGVTWTAGFNKECLNFLSQAGFSANWMTVGEVAFCSDLPDNSMSYGLVLDLTLLSKHRLDPDFNHDEVLGSIAQKTGFTKTEVRTACTELSRLFGNEVRTPEFIDAMELSFKGLAGLPAYKGKKTFKKPPPARSKPPPKMNKPSPATPSRTTVSVKHETRRTSQAIAPPRMMSSTVRPRTPVPPRLASSGQRLGLNRPTTRPITRPIIRPIQRGPGGLIHNRAAGSPRMPMRSPVGVTRRVPVQTPAVLPPKVITKIVEKPKPPTRTYASQTGNTKLYKLPSTRHGLTEEQKRKIAEHDKSKACPFCGKVILRRNQMITHLRAHKGDRPFKCEHCGQDFGDKSKLTQHENTVHLNIRSHICVECGWKFSKKSNLDQHYKSEAHIRVLNGATPKPQPEPAAYKYPSHLTKSRIKVSDEEIKRVEQQLMKEAEEEQKNGNTGKNWLNEMDEIKINVDVFRENYCPLCKLQFDNYSALQRHTMLRRDSHKSFLDDYKLEKNAPPSKVLWETRKVDLKVPKWWNPNLTVTEVYRDVEQAVVKDEKVGDVNVLNYPANDPKPYVMLTDYELMKGTYQEELKVMRAQLKETQSRVVQLEKEKFEREQQNVFQQQQAVSQAAEYNPHATRGYVTARNDLAMHNVQPNQVVYLQGQANMGGFLQL